MRRHQLSAVKEEGMSRSINALLEGRLPHKPHANFARLIVVLGEKSRTNTGDVEAAQYAYGHRRRLHCLPFACGAGFGASRRGPKHNCMADAI